MEEQLQLAEVEYTPRRIDPWRSSLSWQRHPPWCATVGKAIRRGRADA
jgi:hypothetical protein